jgi:hypothetical protein
MSQLRPTFARRRRDYYRNRNSGEKPVPRRKVPAPVRVVLAGAGERPTFTSDEPALVEEERAADVSAPANIRPQEERFLPEAQLR